MTPQRSDVPLRVGVVGAGLIGRRRVLVAHQDPLTIPVVVADMNRGRAEAVAQEVGCQATPDWQEVITRDDVDVVVVSTTNDVLAPVSIAAMQHGKHVLCEKPPGRTPEEARQMMEVAREHGVLLKIGFNHRYHPGIAQAKRYCTQGDLGDLYVMRCVYGHGGRPGYEQEWRTQLGIAGGGELLDQGIHAIDLFRWFLGEFQEVVGLTATYFWPIQPVEDNAFALFRTARGQVASLHTSWTQWKNRFLLEIFGQDGYIVGDGLGGSYSVERLIIGKRCSMGGPPEETVEEFPGEDSSWRAEWEEFIGAIHEGREPMANGYDGWQAMRMVHAVYESSQKGVVVRL